MAHTKQKIYIAYHIEKAGCKIQAYPVVSVGFAIADDIDIIIKHRFNIAVKWYEVHADLQVDYGDFEKKTVDEYWNRIPIDTVPLRANAQSPAEAWAEIAEFIDNLEVDYPESDIIFLTNNSFDSSSIDYYLEFYTGRDPMRFSTKGTCRKVINANDMFEMIPDFEQEKAKKAIADRVEHENDTVNDAHYIYEQYIYAQLWRGSQHEF